MFFKKTKGKQNSFSKIWTEEDMIAEENKPDSLYGNINFSWYPSDLEDHQNRIKIAYRLVSLIRIAVPANGFHLIIYFRDLFLNHHVL